MSNRGSVADGGAREHLLGADGDDAEHAATARLEFELEGPEALAHGLYSAEEEARVRRKLDRHLVLFVSLLYMLSFLDRSNIGNARLAGMEADLQTEPRRDDWYEWALTAFYVAYVGCEGLSLLWKLVPAHVLVSVVVVAWGLAASLQAVAPSYPVLVALRVLLGVAEAGFAGVPFFLSFFFRRDELAFRTAIFISAAPLATSFASSLAWLIVRLADHGPIAPWRLLFLVEGFPSVMAGVAAWSVVPDSPQTASYLSPREKHVAQLRLGQQQQQQQQHSGLAVSDLVAVACDPIAWMAAAMFFLSNMAYSSLPVFLPKIVADMGHSALASQALSAPPFLFAFLVVLATAHVSDRMRARTVPIAIHALASAIGYALLASAHRLGLAPSLRYLAVFPATAGFFSVVTLVIAWSINNQANQTRQGGGFVLMQLVGQCGPFVGIRLYPDADAPYYSRGMQACACAMFSVAVLALILRFYLVRRNRLADMHQVSSNGSRFKATAAPPFKYML
ncbi:hypothetical protein CDD81_4191 [Ophiocordyceps australis]|uniref:Major facilitator superfamily (MFS) profile domain-containing protein n=1 Tax=Ophiocordyceps australis TaxID=1399860 RepID=A0A2C5YAT5_9HYPO|nr:hypothetical protein CDD81_4191 [Ophiocordyceps australis]